MGMLMPLILQLAKLCIIGFALVVHGSSGHNASPSPAEFSSFPPTEGIPGAVKQRSFAPSMPPQPNESDLHSPPALPPLMPVPVPETTEGDAHSSSPINSMEPTPQNTAPPPFPIEEHLPSLAPSIPVVLPPSPPSVRTQNTAPPPFPIEEHLPSLAPSIPVVLPPSPPSARTQNTSPPPFPIEENLPSLAPSFPVVLAPSPPSERTRNTAPPPFPIEEHLPSFAPSTPLVLPPSPPPPLVQVHAPLKPLTAPQEKEPVSKPPVSVPDAPAPVAFLPRTFPRNSPDILPLPAIVPSRNSPETSPVVHQTSAAPPLRNSPQNSPVINSTPVAPQLRNSPQNSPVINSSRSSAFPPTVNEGNSSNNKAPVLEPSAPAPVAPRLRNSPQSSPPLQPSSPRALAPTPSVNQENSSSSSAPVIEPIAPAPVATPSRNSPRNHTPIHSQGPTALPPRAPIPEPPIPVASPPRKVEMTPPPVRPIVPPPISPVKSPPGESPRSSPTVHRNVPVGNPSPLPDRDISPVSNPRSSNDGTPVMSPSNEIHKPVPPLNHTLKNGSSPVISPPAPTARRKHRSPLVPSLSPSNEGHNSSAFSPSTSFHKHQHKRNERTSPAPPPSDPISPPPSKQQGPVLSPSGRKRRHYAPPVSPSHSFVPPPRGTVSPVPSPSGVAASRQTEKPHISPEVSPSVSPPRSPKVAPPLPRVMAFPPPPPNEDCSTTTCTDPYTNTPPGSPCGCVLPMQVGLRLSVALYTFFPLVSELAGEIAAGVFMKSSQVRIMGANAASEQPEKTIVLIDLVPLGEIFDNTTAFITYNRFWHKKVAIKTSLFGDYEVLYVRYLGLPPSPPLPPDAGMIDSGPYPGNNNNARAIKPLGVDVHGKRQKNALSGGIKLVTSSNSTASTNISCQTFSIAPYTGSAKTFTASEIERAADNFDDSRILGEGGFGRVYSGKLGEVDWNLHRGAQPLLGYELIPNGSVESHLHGVDKESSPLNWDARMKIALGAARGLAYLHEDSSPRVIHRDFKSSNILLEHDFTPKVSDFGLARTAMDEEGRHISTRVMGTFGYVAPEYAMTGHLLVKSDVYSYGVVLLELLTGRKPVDMTQPPGQENLVAWARPLLATKEGLETIIDPSLGSDVAFESVAKVAAIAHVFNPRQKKWEAQEVPVETISPLTWMEKEDYRFGFVQFINKIRKAVIRFIQETRQFGSIENGEGQSFLAKYAKIISGSISEHGVMMRFWTEINALESDQPWECMGGSPMSEDHCRRRFRAERFCRRPRIDYFQESGGFAKGRPRYLRTQRTYTSAGDLLDLDFEAERKKLRLATLSNEEIINVVSRTVFEFLLKPQRETKSENGSMDSWIEDQMGKVIFRLLLPAVYGYWFWHLAIGSSRHTPVLLVRAIEGRSAAVSKLHCHLPDELPLEN
ncbi:Serine/threonine-protein kinase PBS1 isoform 4 [Hibiscus syriacus]|uniref:Serine/threonine-protein kinase PBS1 isoform 4 n=1 Tax=Hibiscus syriacus TaxID=106335 RepID=A0A6A3BQZ2_HIBSY|nr:Serine/threonine-protein kinase PBS1 isoform 4 [Hibiscus syriacus]